MYFMRPVVKLMCISAFPVLKMGLQNTMDLLMGKTNNAVFKHLYLMCQSASQLHNIKSQSTHPPRSFSRPHLEEMYQKRLHGEILI